MMVELRERFDIAEKKICRDIDDDPEKSKQNLNRLYNSIVCVRLMPKYVKKEASKKKKR